MDFEPFVKGRGIVGANSLGEDVNLRYCVRLVQTCDGIVTGIQIKARTGDIAA